jgi:hypothetical protein
VLAVPLVEHRGEQLVRGERGGLGRCGEGLVAGLDAAGLVFLGQGLAAGLLRRGRRGGAAARGWPGSWRIEVDQADRQVIDQASHLRRGAIADGYAGLNNKHVAFGVALLLDELRLRLRRQTGRANKSAHRPPAQLDGCYLAYGNTWLRPCVQPV